jgi:hypothetical protein
VEIHNYALCNFINTLGKFIITLCVVIFSSTNPLWGFVDLRFVVNISSNINPMWEFVDLCSVVNMSTNINPLWGFIDFRSM